MLTCLSLFVFAAYDLHPNMSNLIAISKAGLSSSCGEFSVWRLRHCQQAFGFSFSSDNCCVDSNSELRIMRSYTGALASPERGAEPFHFDESEASKAVYIPSIRRTPSVSQAKRLGFATFCLNLGFFAGLISVCVKLNGICRVLSIP